MRALPDLGMEPRHTRVRLQLPPAEHAAGLGVLEAARTVRPPPCRAHRQASEICQRAMANDGCQAARGLDPGRGCEKPRRYGVCGSGCSRGANGLKKLYHGGRGKQTEETATCFM